LLAKAFFHRHEMWLRMELTPNAVLLLPVVLECSEEATLAVL